MQIRGWDLFRIWSTDWFKQPKVEVDRVVARLLMILRTEAASAVVFAEAESAELEFSSDVLGETNSSRQAAEPTWEGEVAAQPMGEQEARDALAKLAAEALEVFPDQPSDAFVLRPEMMDALIKARPVSREDWLRKVPFDLRMVTDGNQLSAFLPRILAITARLAG